MRTPERDRARPPHREISVAGRRILLVAMAGSPFSASIVAGLDAAFRELGCRCAVTTDAALGGPDEIAVRPDLLFVVHGGTVPPERIRAYREAGVVTAVYLLDEPYEVDRSSLWSAAYDWAFSVDRATVPVHAERTRAAFLPLAYDPRTFGPVGKAYASDVLVLGSPYEHRLRLLAPLRRRWGPRITWVGPGWRPFCPEGRHVDRYVTPEICARFYRGARIVLNIHRCSEWSHFGAWNRRRIAATHLNPRVFEAAACGAFQLCSERADLDAFCPEMVRFDGPATLAEALERYDEDESARRAVARAVAARIAPHTYRARAEVVLAATGLAETAEPAPPRPKASPRPVDKTIECGEVGHGRSSTRGAPAGRPGRDLSRRR